MLRPLTIRDNEKENQENEYQRSLVEKRLMYSEWLQYRESQVCIKGERSPTCTTPEYDDVKTRSSKHREHLLLKQCVPSPETDTHLHRLSGVRRMEKASPREQAGV